MYFVFDCSHLQEKLIKSFQLFISVAIIVLENSDSMEKSKNVSYNRDICYLPDIMHEIAPQAIQNYLKLRLYNAYCYPLSSNVCEGCKI